LLLRGLWADVVDDSLPKPQWIARCRKPGASGFPFINSPALQRLLDAGVDVHDLTDAVRSAQVLMIYNFAQLIDEPCRDLGNDVEAAPDMQLGYLAAAGAPHLPGSLHDALEELDPAGRHGQPCSLELRQFGGLPGALRAQINNFLSKQAWSQATMQQLARQL
jgi:hypothetical protein